MAEMTTSAIERLRREKAELVNQRDRLRQEKTELAQHLGQMVDRRDDRIAAIARHLDRLEAAVGDPHGLDVGAVADAVAGLRRAMDGGPGGDPDA